MTFIFEKTTQAGMVVPLTYSKGNHSCINEVILFAGF